MANDLISAEYVLNIMRDLRYELWLRDIPHPGASPEYKEHHRDIQYLLWLVDTRIEEIEKVLGGVDDGK